MEMRHRGGDAELGGFVAEEEEESDEYGSIVSLQPRYTRRSRCCE